MRGGESMPVKDAFTWMFPAASALYLLWVLGSVAAQRLWWRKL
jgi:predicted branched-subunit amino acid permease